MESSLVSMHKMMKTRTLNPVYLAHVFQTVIQQTRVVDRYSAQREQRCQH